MEHKDKTFRRGPVLATAAAFGLATTAMLAPAAHADADADYVEAPAGAVTIGAEEAGTAGLADDGVVGETGGEAGDQAVGEVDGEAGDEAVGEVDGEAGDEVAGEAGDVTAGEAGEDVVTEAGDEVAGEADGAAGDEEATEDILTWNSSELEPVCADVAPVVPSEGDQVPADTTVLGDDAAAEGTVVAEGAVAEGTVAGDLEGETGQSGTAPAGEGAVTPSDCEGTAPGQAEDDPKANEDEEEQLPVGGVDAGIGETASQNAALPIGAGAAAAALALGSYLLVRRSRSKA